MENITQFEVTTSYGEVVQHILIDRGNGEFTSMPKSVYDAQQEAIANYVPLTLPEAPTE
jgi:hypothetical protein